MSETSDTKTKLRVSSTACENVHGSTIIQPGDVVEHESVECRVIEVYPEKEKLKVYKRVAMHSSVETIWAEGVTGYIPREEYDQW